MAEPTKEQFGDGQDNLGQAASKAAEAARLFHEQAAAKGTEMAVNTAAASVQAGLEGGSAVANVAAGTAAGGPWGAAISAAWAMRHTLYKILICICLFFTVIIVLVVALPSIVTESVFGLNGTQPDPNATLESSYTQMADAVSAAVEAGYDQSLAKVEQIIADGGYDYNLTDRDGNPQGTVSFRAVEGEAGVIARMDIAPGTDLKQVTEVKFIDAELWPENAAYQRVEKRKIYWMEDYELTWSEGGPYALDLHVEKKSLPFYCLQDNTNGKEGILVWLSPDEDNYYAHPALKWYNSKARSYLPKAAEAQKVVDKINQNVAYWDTMLSDMKANGYDWYAKPFSLFDDHAAKSKFILNEFYVGLIFDYIMVFEMDVHPAELEWVFDTSLQMYRYMQIQIIPPVK